MISDTLGAFALLCFSSLLALLNPLSVASSYLSLTAGYTLEHQRRTLGTAVLTGGVVLWWRSRRWACHSSWAPARSRP